MLKLTTDKHEASRGLSATTELVCNRLRREVCYICSVPRAVGLFNFSSRPDISPWTYSSCAYSPGHSPPGQFPLPFYTV